MKAIVTDIEPGTPEWAASERALGYSLPVRRRPAPRDGELTIEQLGLLDRGWYALQEIASGRPRGDSPPYTAGQMRDARVAIRAIERIYEVSRRAGGSA